MIDLSQQKIIVTGGSRGIGAGIARSLSKLGATIALSYTSNPEKANEVIDSLPKKEAGEKHFSFKMDISSEEEITTSFKDILKKWGSINGLVNNAGITRDNLLLRMKTEEFDQVLQTNLRGAFLCTKAVLKPMMKARSGSIVNITSVIGQTGNAGQANYAASKAGLEAFTKSVALEMASRNVRANCIAPGFIATEMTDQLNEQQQTDILSQVPLNAMGSTEDIAHAAAFLLSSSAKYITGHTLSVNGGLYM